MRTSLLGVLVVSLSAFPLVHPVLAGSTNGSAGVMPAFYDGERFLINFKELPLVAEQSVLVLNRSINTIFMSDAGLPGGQPFVSVLDAIQGDGFNPLWEEVQITFNAGVTPRQLLSDDEVGRAAQSGEISLDPTGEVYRCAVIGPKLADPAGNPNGSAGIMPAFYDGEAFEINFKELPPDAERSVLARNRSINTIFMSDAGLAGGQPFVSVLDAIQGDGFNPLWEEVQIVFNPGHPPRQFTRDDDIAQAAAGPDPEISLVGTGEVYRCAVVGVK